MPLDDETLSLMRGLASSATGTVVGEAVESSQYGQLVWNVYEGTLRRAFPIAHRALGETVWKELVGAFIAERIAHDPELWRMPRRLIDARGLSDIAQRFSCPWLPDLLRFEWAEIAVFMMKERAISDPCQTEGAALYVINPDSTVVHLSYPVFKTGEPECWGVAGDYFVGCFRRRDSSSVRYVELAPWVVVCLDGWKDCWRTEQELIAIAKSIVGEHAHISDAVRELLRVLCNEGFVLSAVDNTSEGVL